MDKIADASRHAGFAAVIDHGGIVATPDRRELPSCDAGLLDRTFWKLRRATSRPNLVRIPLERKGEFREIEISSLFSNPGGGEKGRIERPRHVDSEFKRGRRVERRILGGVNFEMDSVSLVRHCREFNARLLGRRWTTRPPRKREQHDWGGRTKRGLLRSNSSERNGDGDGTFSTREGENEREGAVTYETRSTSV